MIVKNIVSQQVSVIVPVFNSAKSLGVSLDSVLKQSYDNIEVLVVNDGSTDESLEVCYAYAKKDHRLVVIDQKNEGVSVARNVGLDAARGDYVIFLDPDDTFAENAIETMVRTIRDSNADLARTSYRSVSDGISKDISSGSDEGLYSGEKLSELRFLLASGGMRCYAWLLIIKREYLNKVGVRFPAGISMMEDAWFYSDILKYADSVFISDDITYNYSLNENGASNSINRFAEKLSSVLNVNKHISRDGFDEVQINFINANYLAVIMNMLMVRSAGADANTIGEMMELIRVNNDFINLFHDVDKNLLTNYQRTVLWAVINKRVSVVLILKVIRKLLGR